MIGTNHGGNDTGDGRLPSAPGSGASHEAASASSPKASIPSAWPQFNMNHEVAVRLTEDGLAIMRRNHDRLNAGHLFPGNRPGLLGDFKPPKTDAEGWTRFQLWSLMHEFGAEIFMGRPVPFETTILLDASAIEARKAVTRSGTVADESAGPKDDAQEVHP